jgi:hypothetical protein
VSRLRSRVSCPNSRGQCLPESVRAFPGLTEISRWPREISFAFTVKTIRRAREAARYGCPKSTSPYAMRLQERQFVLMHHDGGTRASLISLMAPIWSTWAWVFTIAMTSIPWNRPVSGSSQHPARVR